MIVPDASEKDSEVEAYVDRLIKPIRGLLQRVRDIFPLGNGFWCIKEYKQKSTIVEINRPNHRIDKCSEKGLPSCLALQSLTGS